jgi:ElaA protein
MRSEIFIVEQNCPYMDFDEKDRKSYHLFGRNEARKVTAFTRILPKTWFQISSLNVCGR